MLPSRLRSTALQIVARLCKPKHRPMLVVGTVLVFVGLHFGLAIASVQHKSATFDEVAHVTAGYSYWTQGDYRLHPENGNLPQRWMTLPLVLWHSDLKFPIVDSDNWHKSDLWQLGDEFFYQSGNDFEMMLFHSRATIAVASVILCLLVFLWSRSLFGNAGGLISLALCALSPTVLAHGRLATSDLFTTLFFAGAIWTIWKLLHGFSPRRLALGAVAVSGLFLCKTSAALILPMAAIMALVSLVPQQTIVLRLSKNHIYELSSQWARRAYVLVMTVVIGLAAYSSVWAAYGFRYSASVEANHQFYKFQDIDSAVAKSGDVGSLTKWLADHRVLPEAYLYGVAFVAAHEERPAFLNGDYRTTGWPQFFPYCLAVKTPLALFGMLAVSCFAARVKTGSASSIGESPWRETTNYQLVPIATSLLVFWSVFLTTQLNIGHRHILPTYPLMFVLAGGAAKAFHVQASRRITSRAMVASVFVLLCWTATETLASFPHYLGYFNQLVPKEKAYRHLVDSSLDWGQDLPSLRKWLDEHNTTGQRVFLGYFGNADPNAHGISATPLPLIEFGSEPLELEPGVYCISATCLQAVYGNATGRWNVQYENYYQLLNSTSFRDRPNDFETRQDWDVLKARRLCAYLRHREPDANAGYSILIYRVSRDQLDEALFGSPVELDDLSWEQQRAKVQE